MSQGLSDGANQHWREQIQHPRSGAARPHAVQFYEDDQFLANTVALYAASGLHNQEGVVLITTLDHRERIAGRLAAQGFDLAQLMQRRQLMLLDAAETLSKFMADGMPVEAKFKELIGGLLRELRARYGFVRAYGEMVGLLRDAGNLAGCDALEGAWNELAQGYSFALLCGYRLRSFGKPGDERALARVCGSHSTVLPAESFLQFESANDQFRGVLELQQRILALESALAAPLSAKE